MVSKIDSSIEIVKKVTYVYLIGSKVVLYLCFSSSFLFNVVMICHFITVNTLDRVESGCFTDLTHVHNTSDMVESGYNLDR